LSTRRNIAVVGGGPAGLRAAEVAAERGAHVTVYDAKPSVGRKFLVAGKSGLNLTNTAEFPEFAAVYSGESLRAETWRSILRDFDRDALRAWSASLGVETMATSSGKVFPKTMKAAPLLRRWVERLRHSGVKFALRHRLAGITSNGTVTLTFDTPQGTVRAQHDAAILALGGGSWPETGSDGTWPAILAKLGVKIHPLQAANCGWEVAWAPETRERVEGRPLQNIHASAGECREIGELMLTRYGMEGTAVYRLGRALRHMAEPTIELDLKPTFTVEQLVRKMESVRRDYLKEAGVRWKLPDAACAILAQFHGPFSDAPTLAAAAKHCRIPLVRPRPLEEAISSAGGVAWDELTEELMFRKVPHIYCAGEMLDWEAPTGGFLLQGCFASGTRAGRAASVEILR
jgi:uncharacterized flavoprotein (TIGR03862 family)